MMRQIIQLTTLFFWLFRALTTFGQIPEDSNKIFWSADTKLVWDDFRGKIVPGFQGAASVHGVISYNASFENDSLVFNVYCWFEKDKSWKRDVELTAYLLNHEQVHFDIFELYARKLRKEMLEADLSFDNLQKTMDKVFNEMNKECRKKQTEYDNETNHSLNREDQDKWTEWSEQELDKLRDYVSVSYSRIISP